LRFESKRFSKQKDNGWKAATNPKKTKDLLFYIISLSHQFDLNKKFGNNNDDFPYVVFFLPSKNNK